MQRWSFGLLCLIWAVGGGLYLLPHPPYPLALILHFYPQALVSLGVLMIGDGLCFFRQRKHPLSTSLFLGVLWGVLALPVLAYLSVFSFGIASQKTFAESTAPVDSARPVTSTPLSSKPFKLVLSNVFFDNPQTDTFSAWLAAVDPDVVVIEELNRSYETLMNANALYPYRQVVYTGDPFGIGIWSKQAFEQVEPLRLGPAELPSLHARFDNGLHVLATHPVPPISPDYFVARNAQFDELAAYAKSLQGHKVVVGDLNITPWSGYYRGFEAESGLRNARQGRGILPSWPAQWPGLLRIPIDHVLLSPALRVEQFQMGPEIGSDHLPVFVTLTGDR